MKKYSQFIRNESLKNKLKSEEVFIIIDFVKQIITLCRNITTKKPTNINATVNKHRQNS